MNGRKEKKLRREIRKEIRELVDGLTFFQKIYLCFLHKKKEGRII